MSQEENEPEELTVDSALYWMWTCPSCNTTYHAKAISEVADITETSGGSETYEGILSKVPWGVGCVSCDITARLQFNEEYAVREDLNENRTDILHEEGN